MARLTQREIDQRSGHDGTFWRNVQKRSDGKWMWTGYTNNNHNTVDCASYDYGEFQLVSRETANDAKPEQIHKSRMAHHIVLFLTFCVELDAKRYEVSSIDGDRLNINPENLIVRDKKTRREWPAAVFFAANDNGPLPLEASAARVAA